MGAGREATAALWPARALRSGWVGRAAPILGAGGPKQAGAARRQGGGLLGAIARHGARRGPLAGAAAPLVRVSRSSWPGLFPCYEGGDLPRTNNDQEPFFGAPRYHERRASGRQGASPALVRRGPARLRAAAAPRQRGFTVAELSRADRGRGEQLRRQLEARRQRRVQRRRCRRDPQAFLQQLQDQLLQSALPA